MSDSLPEASLQRQKQTDDHLVQTWRERIQRAKEARRPYEKIWLSNLAFAAGQHWLVWDDQAGGRMRHIQEVDPSQAGRTLYTADRINEFLQAQFGELNSDDDRPELLTAQDGENAEQIAKELNLAVAHCWEHEANATSALMRARQFCLIMGHSAVRLRFDPSQGAVTDHQPTDSSGKPVSDPAALDMLEQHGVLPDGSLPKFQSVYEGRSVMEPYTAFQTLTPPGVVHEDDFPWEILVRPVLLDDVKDEYGAKADGLQEDTDIASAAGLSTGQQVGQMGAPTVNSGNARLRDHVWLYTCFRKPCRQYPDGQTVILAGNSFKLLDQKPQLPYKTADGCPSSGVVYLHWWRLADRFQSRSFIEPLKDPQRLINERETQNAEIIRRGLPKVFVKKGDLPDAPNGDALEVVEMDEGADEPHFFNGIGPGPWMYQDLEHHADNLSHASTLSPLRLGENPPNIDTYSQLFLINENEGRKRDMILTDQRAQVGRLVEFIVHDIREFWPDEKLITVSGEDGQITREQFQKSTVPDFYVVKKAGGAAAPRSQAAEVKKIDAIWNAAVEAQIVLHDPETWVRWYAGSLDADQALDLPETPNDEQTDKAKLENSLLAAGEPVSVAYYDPPPVHIPIHRDAQIEAEMGGDLDTVAAIEQHIQEHMQMAAEVAMQNAAAQPQPSLPPGPGVPAAGPGPIPGPPAPPPAPGQ